jgi:hypothetical protein
MRDAGKALFNADLADRMITLGEQVGEQIRAAQRSAGVLP